MSRTYRRVKEKRNNTNLKSYYQRTDKEFLLEKYDYEDCYVKWLSLDTNMSEDDIRKVDKAFYHSDAMYSRFSKTRKKLMIKKFNKSLRSDAKLKLCNFIKTGDQNHFHEVVKIKPDNVIYHIW